MLGGIWIPNFNSYVAGQLSPRFFVVYPDGSGEELLRYDDIIDYLQEANLDPESAVICTEVENDCDAEAITVIKPFKRM